jgi:DNA-binding NarL/FixJ family response regulator
MYELSQPDGSVQARVVEPSPLSKRETQIVRELAKGLTYKEIAHEVGLSSSTVRSHLHNVYKKLEVVDRAQAVMAANARGWI